MGQLAADEVLDVGGQVARSDRVVVVVLQVRVEGAAVAGTGYLLYRERVETRAFAVNPALPGDDRLLGFCLRSISSS